MSAPTEKYRETARELAHILSVPMSHEEMRILIHGHLCAVEECGMKRGLECAGDYLQAILDDRKAKKVKAGNDYIDGCITSLRRLEILSEITQSPPHSPGAGEARDGHLSSGPSRATNPDSTRDAT